MNISQNSNIDSADMDQLGEISFIPDRVQALILRTG